MNYFTLENQTELINLHGRKPIYEHKSRAEYFSEKIHSLEIKIFDEFYKRNYEVPGFHAEFCLNPNDAKYYIWKLENLDMGFRISSDNVWIPQKSVSVYKDGSGSLDLFVGKKWEKEKEEFMNGRLFHRNMDKKSRINLHYHLRTASFIHEEDSREHSPNSDEPTYFSMSGVCKEIEKYLQKVLDKIMEHPVPEPKQMIFEPEHIQLTNDIVKKMKLYVFKDLRYGRGSEDKIIPGKRLMCLGEKLPDHPEKDQMHEGFVYMEIDKMLEEPGDTSFYESFFGFGSEKTTETYEVNPTNYNNFWIIDVSVFPELKAAWFKDNPKETRLTDKLVDEFKGAQANTMVRINEYKGDYKTPIVITNRILWPDELRLIKFPKKKKQKA